MVIFRGFYRVEHLVGGRDLLLVFDTDDTFHDSRHGLPRGIVLISAVIVADFRVHL